MCAVVAGVAGAGGGSVRGRGGEENIVQNKLASSNNEFAFDLYKKICHRHNDDDDGRSNIFLSPASISTALAMVYMGTRGDTKKQMMSSMYLSVYKTNEDVNEEFKALLQILNSAQNYTLVIANRLFGQERHKFKEEFLRDTKTYYKASLEAVDFQHDPDVSRRHINDWVAEKTSQKIKDLLPSGSISSATTLVLVNAIYFKGIWLTQFKRENTRNLPFHLSIVEKSSIEMMKINEGEFNYYNDSHNDCQVLELPYVGHQASMFIILPNNIEGLPRVENVLEADRIDEILKRVRSRKVDLIFPKFVINQGVALKQFLQSMGIEDLFDAGKADLSGIDGSKSLVVTEVMHKAFVEVNEEGTEAAGSTGIEISFKSIRFPEKIQFIVDRPFLFFIVERTTGTVLFLGRFIRPPRASDGNIGIFGQTAEQRGRGGEPNEDGSSSKNNFSPTFETSCSSTVAIFIFIAIVNYYGLCLPS